MTQANAEKLGKVDWGDLAKKLTAFVIHYMNYCSGKKFKDWNLPEGQKPEDVAQKAIADVLTGQRNWDPEKHPDFLRYMQYSVCRSIISNLYARSDRQKNKTINQSDCFGPNETPDFEYYNGNHVNFGLHYEQFIDNDIFLQKMETALESDDMGQMVLLSVLDGNPPRMIAKDLGISEDEVANAKKRIKRAAEKILISLN